VETLSLRGGRQMRSGLRCILLVGHDHGRKLTERRVQESRVPDHGAPPRSPLQMSSELANPSRPLSLDAIYFGSSPVSFQAVKGHTLPFVSSEWTQDCSSVATVLSRFSLVPPSLDSEPPFIMTYL
jgi:hypothetical protein